MVEQDVEQLDPEIIERLMMTDPAFMAKISDVKTRIYDNMSIYANSIGEAENGMFTSEEVSEMTSAKDSIMSSWNALQNRLNIDLSMSSDGGGDGEDVFEAETPTFILESLGDNAVTQIKNIMGKDSEAGVNTQVIHGSSGGGGGGGGGGIIDQLLGSIMTTTMTTMGITGAPAWVTSLAAKAGALAPVIALAAGIIWMAIDGVKGFFKADEWGVGKASGLLGGLLGGTDSGIRGALKNFGKWALIGVRIGAAGGPVGMIVGGLVGGIIGAILGWIGGEKIAKFFDPIEKWFQAKFEAIFMAFKDGFWKGIWTIYTSIMEGYMNAYKWIWNGIKAIGTWIWDKFSQFFLNAAKSVKEWFNMITDFWGDAIFKAWEWIKNAWQSVKEWFNMITDFWGGVITKITTGFDTLTTGIAEVFGDIGNWFSTIKDRIFENISKIKNWFADKLSQLNPRNWGWRGKEKLSDANFDRIARDSQEEIVKRRTNDPPMIVIGELLESDKKTQEALDANNIFAEQMVQALQEMNTNLVKGSNVQGDLLTIIAEKPVADGGSGEISLDFGDIRESTLDASFDYRSTFHSRRGI